MGLKSQLYSNNNYIAPPSHGTSPNQMFYVVSRLFITLSLRAKSENDGKEKHGTLPKKYISILIVFFVFFLLNVSDDAETNRNSITNDGEL